MVEKCYICRRTKKDLDTLFKEILVPFREKVVEIDIEIEKIVKEGKEKMEAFKLKHQGNDYLKFNFQTIKTDKEQFEKLIPGLSDFINYQNYRTYKKFDNRVKLQEVIEYVTAPDFWEISMKKKYVNEDPRIELQRLMKKKEEWQKLICDLQFKDHSMKMFSKKAFDFLSKEEKKEVTELFARKTTEVQVCPVCRDLLLSAGRSSLKFI